MSDAFRIPAIGLHGHRLQDRLDLARFHQDQLEAGFGQFAMEPLRERSGLEADRLDEPGQLVEERDEGLRFAGQLRALQDASVLVEHAERRTRERYVDADGRLSCRFPPRCRMRPAYPLLAAP